MRWTVETVDAADAEIAALQPGVQARLLRLFELIEAVGLENLNTNYVKHLDGKLWELRVKAQEGIGRGIYFTLTGRRIIVLHVFIKKTQKTPKTAIALARGRMNEVIS